MSSALTAIANKECIDKTRHGPFRHCLIADHRKKEQRESKHNELLDEELQATGNYNLKWTKVNKHLHM